jgi:hypothetical protein
MATTVLVNSVQNSLSNTIQTFYTSPADGAGTVITAFTATNNTGSNRTYKAYIFASGATSVEAVTPLKIVIRNRFDPGNAIVNHVIPPGGTLRMETDLLDTIVYRVTGNELS